MLATAEVGLFDWPIFCPRPANSKDATKKYVQDWISKTNPSLPERTSLGTYAGIATFLLGAVTALVGLIKDSQFAKYLGGLLALVGTSTVAIGKFCGVEFDVIDSLHNKVIYKPPTKLETTPGKEGIPHEEVLINTPDGEKLHGYYLPSPVKTNKTVIYLHGRANNISSCLKEVSEMQKQVPVNILMIDFRGFGLSTLNCQSITRDGVITDAEAMYDYLVNVKKCKPEDISLFGHSLGGAVAIQLAKKREVNSLVIQSSFTSLKDVAKEFLSSVIPDSLLSLVTGRDEFNSLEAIKNVRAKYICVCHGTKDKVVSPEQGKRLFLASNTPKELILLEGAGHGDYMKFYKKEDLAKLAKFFGVDSNSQQEGTKAA